MVSKILNYTLLIFFLLLPWQTRYIITDSDNQFTIISLYVFEVWLVVMLAVWLWYWYRHRSSTIYWPVFWLSCTILILIGLSAYWASDRTVSVYYWLQVMAAFVVFGIICHSSLSSRWVFRIFLANGIVQAGFILWQNFQQQVIGSTWLGMATQWPEVLGTPVVVTAASRWLRAFGTLPHPNTTAALLVISLVSAVILWKIEHNRFWRYAILVATGLLTLGLMLTWSRSGIIVWLLMIGLMLIWRWRAWPVITTTLGTIAVVATIYFPLVVNRIATVQSIEVQSLSDRQNQITEALQLLPRYWPQGVGIGNYTVISQLPDPQPVHFVPLLILVETGVFITLLWYSLLGWTLWQIDRRSVINRGSSLLLITTLLLGCFDHYFWTLPTMLFLWITIIALTWKDGKILTKVS